MAFYGHLRKMEPEIIANKILIFQANRKTQEPWVKEIHQDIDKCGIREEGIGNREVFRIKNVEVKVLPEEKSNRTNGYYQKYKQE